MQSARRPVGRVPGIAAIVAAAILFLLGGSALTSATSATPAATFPALTALWENEPDTPPLAATCGFPGCNELVPTGTKTLLLGATAVEQVRLQPCEAHAQLSLADKKIALSALVPERIQAIDTRYQGASERITALQQLLVDVP